MPSRRTSLVAAAGLAPALFVALAVCAACSGGGRREWGEPFDTSRAIPLAELLAAPADPAPGMVTVRGTIGEVCRSAGCWFVLQDPDPAAGEMREILVDLKGGADFTVPTSIRGRRAVVRGRLVGEAPDLRIDALALVVEP